MTNSQDILKLSSLILIPVIVIGVLSWAYLNYRQAENIVNPNRVITFTAEGKVLAKPDVAEVNISVITQNKNAAVVQQENNQRMAKIVDFVRKQGVKEEDIKTIRYDLSPRYDYNWCRTERSSSFAPCPPKIIGYQLTQTIKVKIRDFNKIGEIVGRLSSLGANKVSQIEFKIDDAEKYQNQARIIALQKIRKRAALLSQKAGIRLGRIIEISEGNIYRPVSSKYAPLSAPEVVEEEASAPIETGSEEVRVQLIVKYEIK
ncbi:SIMPL domain-containing protein [bacterium]|nr:SIMPL domain-containing protein [bacterium]